MKFRAISIRQPWAWLIMNAGKDIENRTWNTRYRGRLLIHASSHLAMPDIKWLNQFNIRLPDEFQRGGIVGEVELIDVVRTSDSPWFTGPYGFVLAHPKLRRFTVCRGYQGIFTADIQRRYFQTHAGRAEKTQRSTAVGPDA